MCGSSAHARRCRKRKPRRRKKPHPSLPNRPLRVKLNFNETRELEALPGKIEALEREQQEIGAKLADGEIYRSDPQGAKRLQARVSEIEEEMLVVLARWEELEAKQKSAAGE